MKDKKMKNIVAFANSLAVVCALIGCAASPSRDVAEGIMFDDFAYQDNQSFSRNGWTARTETGHPGIPGAAWSEEGISFHSDVPDSAHGVVRMSSITDGTSANTRQTQFCHARKYREGTYAARVFFRDEPTFGPDGDEVIQTFYAISPLRAPMDKDYSETDFEYLPIPAGALDQGKRIYS
jgi:hypothetical protein